MNCPTERSVIRSIEKMWSTDCIAYGIRVRLDSFSSGCLRTIRLGLGHETSVSVACLLDVQCTQEQSPLRIFPVWLTHPRKRRLSRTVLILEEQDTQFERMMYLVRSVD